MKSRTLSTWVFGLLLTGLPVISGCAQGTAPPPQTTNASSPPAAVVDPQTETNLAAIAAVDPETVKPVVPDKDAATARPLPANVWLSPALKEVVQMAQAGVEDGVILAFVTNSSATFNLGSDQIIYLNDLGVSESVTTTMIQHDKDLGVAGAQAATAPAVAAPPPEPGAEQAAGTPPQYAPAAEAVTQDQYAPGYAAPEPETQPTAVNYNYFYDSLAPYGTWVNMVGYGWCWQPTIAVIHGGWSPYCNGGWWLHSDLGWYWRSDYTWGGIAFHYGRWFCHPRWGWCWRPDLVWGPAWVTWRYGGDYCGWAPLPPSIHRRPVEVALSPRIHTFVPWDRFYHHRPVNYRIPSRELTKVFDKTTAHESLAAERVTAITKTQIRTMTVRDLPGGSARNIRADRPQTENGRLVVYRHAPPVPPTAAAAPAGQVRTSPASGSPAAGQFSAARPDFSGRLGRTPTPGAKLGSVPQPRAPAFTPNNSSRPSPDRGAGATIRPDKAPSSSIILDGRRDNPTPNRATPTPPNVTRGGSSERGSASGASASPAAPSTSRQNRDLNSTASRPSFSQSAPTPQPRPPATAPTFSRPAAPPRAAPSQVRVIRQEPVVVSRPVAREVAPGPRFDAPAPRASVPQPSQTETIAAPPARAAKPPPAAASSGSDRSSANSDRGGGRGRDTKER